MFILSQVWGVLGFGFVLIAMALKNRRRLLLYKLFSTLFVLLSYFFIGSSVGVLIAFVSLVRGLFVLGFTYKEDEELKKLSILFLFILTITLNVIFWESALNILSIVISSISIFGFFQTNVFLIRVFSIMASVLEIVLNLIMLNPTNIFIEIFTISSCVYGMLKHDLIKFKVRAKRML